MRVVDGVNVHDGCHFCKKCGWIGKELKKNGCVTHADTWYECPNCGEDASKVDLVPANRR
jgi:hypothetical protein